MRTEKKPKSKPKECPLLKRHGCNSTSAEQEDPLAIIICNQCPLQACIFERAGAHINRIDREILLNAEIVANGECPKCGARKWAFRDEEGNICCLFCGYIAYKQRGKLLR